MEIVAEYGSDALRMGIIASRSAGQNQAFSTSKIVAGRNFCNKLWNIARYIQSRTGDDYRPQGELRPLTTADHWIIRQLNVAADAIEDHLTNYRFAEAAETVYHTVWNDVADWYVEVSKKQDNVQMLAWVLDTTLKLTHPFAPFVTETIWQTLDWHHNLLMTKQWPNDNPYDEIAAAAFERVQEFVSETRYVMAELPAGKKYSILYQNDGLIADNIDVLTHLTRVKEIKQVDQPTGLRLASSNREAWLDVDKDTLYEHQTNLEKRLAETRQQIANLSGRLANENYVNKAPAHLIEETRKELEQKEAYEVRLQAELSVLSD